MRSVRLVAALIRWDVIREMRRRDTIPNMILFALLVLFVGQMGIGPDRGPESVAAEVGPVFFWITILFAGTVGLARAFSVERESDSLGAILTSPADLGLFYLAKVAATWTYVMVMAGAALGIYAVLFGFSAWSKLGLILAAEAAFSLAYIAVGVVLAAMTSSTGGASEVLLRILLFPMMIPIVWLTLRTSDRLFDAEIAGGALGPPIRPMHFFAAVLAFDTIYLCAGYLLFPKVLEE
jgi:heme exporter protein B